MKVKVSEWTASLRSGDYQQGRAWLRTAPFDGEDGDVKHCCLGVLCDLAGAAWEPVRGSNVFCARFDTGVGPEISMSKMLGQTARNLTGALRVGAACTLPVPVCFRPVDENDTVQTVVVTPELKQRDNALGTLLMNLNDGGASFQQIADVIDALCDPDYEIDVRVTTAPADVAVPA